MPESTPAPSSSLPNEILQSIAISNAKSIGEQPAILANLALSQQIANNNLLQQQALSEQQAMGQIAMATLAKGASAVESVLDPARGTPPQA